MTVLVTGGTGFVRSHVVARLVTQGHAVRLLVRDPAKLARVPALDGHLWTAGAQDLDSGETAALVLTR